MLRLGSAGSSSCTGCPAINYQFRICVSDCVQYIQAVQKSKLSNQPTISKNHGGILMTRQLTAHLGLKRIRAALWSFARRSAALLQGAERGAGICDLSHIMPRHATSLLRVLSVPSFVFGIMHLTYRTCV